MKCDDKKYESSSYKGKMLNSLDQEISRFEAQSILFSKKLNRLSIQKLDIQLKTEKEITVNVWRNHGFEPLEPIMVPFFKFRAIDVKFNIGGYDDSFSFTDYENASLDIIWLDSNRILENMLFGEYTLWLDGRIKKIREISSAPIILCTWFDDKDFSKVVDKLVEKYPAVYFSDLESVMEGTELSLIDNRSLKLSGTSVSRSAQILIARELACHWIPGAVLPPVKALALDLDNTLYRGVLGEDGISGISLTEGHKDLQEYIKSLINKGIFISIVSRNEKEDVEELFHEREDFPLDWDDFIITDISWGSKADAIKRIAKKLRISTDAILFVDDNVGELATVIQNIENINSLHASEDANLTLSAIKYFSGLWRWNSSTDDFKRIKDLKASFQRETLSEGITDQTEYFKSLKVKLKYYINEEKQLDRLSELSNKTNQFNLSMKRFNPAEIYSLLKNENSCIVSVQLSDRLADSGIIAIIVGERDASTLKILELCISCRAMGRQLENSIILESIKLMPIFEGVEKVLFDVNIGPRNQPAIKWLNNLSLTESSSEINRALIDSFEPIDGVIFDRGDI